MTHAANAESVRPTLTVTLRRRIASVLVQIVDHGRGTQNRFQVFIADQHWRNFADRATAELRAEQLQDSIANVLAAGFPEAMRVAQ